MSDILGIDIGGSKIAAGLVNSKGQVKKFIKTATPKRMKTAGFIEFISEFIQPLVTPGVRIGIAAAGQVDFTTGKIHHSPNIQALENVNLVQRLGKKFPGHHFKIDNDAHCFVRAESVFGAGKGYKNVIGLTIGTGIGGGMMVNGLPYRGHNNTAGEFGHIIIETKGPVCGCGHKGHWEALAGGRATDKKIAHDPRQRKKIIQEQSHFIGVGLANIVNALDPDIIVLGGGVTNEKQLVSMSLHEAKKLLLYKSLEKTKITKGKLGEAAGIIGASLLFKK